MEEELDKSPLIDFDYKEMEINWIKIILDSSPPSKTTWEAKISASASVLKSFYENECHRLEDALELNDSQLQKSVPQSTRFNKIKSSLDK